jgi:predicted nucleic acid-binding protein
MEMIDLLHLAGDPVLVPAAVAGEVARRGGADAAVQALRSVDWLRQIDDLSIPPHVQALRLGSGEQAVIAWALAHPETEAILDDLDARRHAVSLGVPVRGTLSLVLEAKHVGLIDLARPVVDRLRWAGLYLSDHVVDRALRLVGE